MSVTGDEIYQWLLRGSESQPCEAFDAHVTGCLLGLGLVEAQSGTSIVEALGLTQAELCELARFVSPHAEGVLRRVDPALVWSRPVDEACLQEYLFRGASEGSRFEYLLSCMIARRAQRPHHLWQELGLRQRRELSWLMQRHFEPIAARNYGDMKWKKFLYRQICRDEGFTLCPAPSCQECSDLAACFGEEEGESLLAAATTVSTS